MVVVVHNKVVNYIKSAFIKKLTGIVFSSLGVVAFSTPSFAVEANDVAKNITQSAVDLPGLVAAISYLLALIIGISGIFKLKDHVENPSQNPLRTPLIRFAIAGALIALPIIYEALLTTINGGSLTDFSPSNGAVGAFLTILAGLTNLPGISFITLDFNSVLHNITSSIQSFPGFISALAYLLGLIIGVSGLLKLKDYVENPEQNPLREGVIRLLVGGALFGLPTIYDAMANAIGGAGIMGTVTAFFGSLNFVRSGYAVGGTFCNPISSFGTNASMGDALCGVITHAGAFPAFLTAVAYMIGLVMGLWGIFKIKAHVLNPSQTSLAEGVTKLLVGGAFFALPVIIEVARNSVAPTSLTPAALRPVTSFNDGGAGCGSAISGALSSFSSVLGGLGGFTKGASGNSGGGLDCSLISMMNDVLGPMHIVLNFFAFSAGVVLIMLGLSRIIKMSQEGARGPGAMGTVGTFIAAGALISYNELVRAVTQTMSMGAYGALPVTRTFATLPYGDSDEMMHATAVLSAILKFMIIVGLISFVRGIFIIRDVAEGTKQASLMAGVTHVVGGALAVNLGPLMMMVQSTLGISGYGITFT